MQNLQILWIGEYFDLCNPHPHRNTLSDMGEEWYGCFAILHIVVFEYSTWGILKNGNDKIQTFPKKLWWCHTVRMPTPCWMVSGCCIKSATLVMIAVQSSQVQSPRKLFTCWRYFWLTTYNARDVTAMIIIIIIIIFFNNDYPPCKDQGAHRRRQLRWKQDRGSWPCLPTIEREPGSHVKMKMNMKKFWEHPKYWVS